MRQLYLFAVDIDGRTVGMPAVAVIAVGCAVMAALIREPAEGVGTGVGAGFLEALFVGAAEVLLDVAEGDAILRAAGDGEHEVGGGGAFGERTAQADADDLGRE